MSFRYASFPIKYLEDKSIKKILLPLAALLLLESQAVALAGETGVAASNFAPGQFHLWARLSAPRRCRSPMPSS